MDFSLSNVRIRLLCHPSARLDSVARLWEQTFSLDPVPERQQQLPPEILFRIHEQSEPALAAGARTLYEAPGFTLCKTHTGYHVRSHGSFLTLTTSDGRCEATGSLTENFFDQPVEFQRGLFLFAFLLLLPAHGLFGLHAAAVSRHGRGLLLAGDSGCGKTTLTLALIRSGWNYLADDTVLLRRAPSPQPPAGAASHACGASFSLPPDFSPPLELLHRNAQPPVGQASGLRGASSPAPWASQRPAPLEALGFGRSFSCTATTMRHFAELNNSAQTTNNGKRLVDIASHYPGQLAPRAQPAAILFPEITDAPRSSLIALDPTATVVRLLRQSAGFFDTPDLAAGQLRVLADLANSVPAYRLLHGQDVLNAPQHLSALLTQQISIPSPPRHEEEGRYAHHAG